MADVFSLFIFDDRIFPDEFGLRPSLPLAESLADSLFDSCATMDGGPGDAGRAMPGYNWAELLVVIISMLTRLSASQLEAVCNYVAALFASGAATTSTPSNQQAVPPAASCPAVICFK